MIHVVKWWNHWYWFTTAGSYNHTPYTSPDHALRDAWTWVGRAVPALIYTRRP